MKPTNPKSPYSLSLVWNLIRHGLILQGIRYVFAKIGIDIMPYYWVQEEAFLSEAPTIKSENQDFLLKSLDTKDIDAILAKSDSINQVKINQSIKDGQECVGLVQNGNIAAYMFIELKDFTFKKRRFEIKKHEAYLLNMYTFDEFRGQNLAPYLRYLCYRYIEEKGITTKYSISNYYNKSAIRFKEKLNSKHLKLFLNIELFNKFQWHFVLKSFR
jgi:ribosomal protein S18 acetylase RimI-like enzyme